MEGVKCKENSLKMAGNSIQIQDCSAPGYWIQLRLAAMAAMAAEGYSRQTSAGADIGRHIPPAGAANCTHLDRNSARNLQTGSQKKQLKSSH